VTGVSDGDTFYIKDEDKGVRLVGIDTPEVIHNDGSGSANCGGEAAKAQVSAWLQYGVSVCLIQDPSQNYDTFGRKVRYVYFNLFGKPTLLNAKLLQLGHARVFDEYAKKLKLKDALYQHQEYARTYGVGGWGACANDCWWTDKKPCP
jgi:endonuclease YncB( thermonuclease family)